MDNPYASKPWLKFYDKHVPEKLTYPENKLVTDLFRESVAPVKNKVAVYYAGKGTAFGELDILSSKFANFLIQQGLKQGDVIGVYMPNVLANYIAVMGILKAGCVVTGVSPLLSHKELDFQLNNSGAKALVAIDILWNNISPVINKTGIKTVVMVSIADFLPSFKKMLGKLLKKIPSVEVKPIAGVAMHNFMDIMKKMPATDPKLRMDSDSACMIMYTGGTTGVPKGAVITHKGIVNHLVQLGVWLEIKPGSNVFLTAFPMFHMAGLFLSVWGMASGMTQIAVTNPRDTVSLVNSLKKYKPTLIGNVPTIYIELLKLPAFRRLDFSNLRICYSSSAPIPAEYIREMETIMGKNKVIEALGMTESGPVHSSAPLYSKKKIGSVGIPLPDVEVKIVDPITKEIVPQGEPGELVVKGPQIFKGYHNMPEETDKTLQDGWLYTGDVVRMDEDGYFFMVDRSKDMVNVSGYKVFTRELDDLITEHQAVAIAASVGVPNPERPGIEMVASAIVLKPGFEKSDETRNSIIEYVKQHAAPYKVPKKIVFMDQLPTSAVGKILKRELREMLKT